MENWEIYLAALYDEALVSTDFDECLLIEAEKFVELLQPFLEAGLAFPNACIEHTFMFFWDEGPCHLEAEIYEDGVIEFFFRDRSTEEHWFDNVTTLEGFNEEIENKLKFMARFNV